MTLPAHVDPDDAWRMLRAELRRRVGEHAFEVWFAGLAVAEWDGRWLRLVGVRETELWVSHRYGRVLAEVAEDVLGAGTGVRFTAGEQALPPGGGQAPDDGSLSSSFNPRYRFEQFIIGETNQFAHAAALAVAENPGQAYNPLFLYAPPGLGKTHLLHAIGNYIVRFGGGATVRYATAESFTNHFLTALNTKSIDAFKRTYRTADALLVDDVQFLAEKARTEEEFFHTFNALYETGRQLVLTCDRLPRALTGIEQRLRERFEAGLVADIRAPDHVTRVAILRKRAAIDGITVNDPRVLGLIADRVQDNIRLLEGALIRVVAFHSLTQRPIDVPLTGEVLDTMYPAAPARPGTATGGGSRSSDGPLSIHAIQLTVATHFGLTIEQITSPSRAAAINWARQVAIALSRDLTPESLPAIGGAFGGRNHATIINALKRVSERMKTDPEAVETVARLRREITGGHDDRPA